MNIYCQQNIKKATRGKIEKIALQSKILAGNRKLYLYLPPSYTDNSTQRYPVLYMHYGQHLFEPQKLDGESWRVHETIEQLLDADLIDEMIVVGIGADPATVVSDYWHYGGFYKNQPLTGNTYESFIVQEVKPFIDRNFRTLSDRSHTAMIGACSGATVSYNIAERNPDVFGKVGMISPAVRSIDTNTWLYSWPMRKPEFMLWIDVGDAEGIHTFAVKELVDVLLTEGFVPNTELFYYLEPDAAHHETYWRNRLKNPLLLFFGKKGQPVSLELQGENILGLGSKPLTVNPIVEYDTGLRCTALTGNYYVEPPEMITVEQGNRMTGLSLGTNKVFFFSQGLETSRSYTVVSSLPDQVQVHLRAHVPEHTPEVEQIYFGTLPLQRSSVNTYEGKYTLPRGFALRDVFSCGMRNFERQKDGSPIPLRLLQAQDNTEIEYKIERWSKF
ncbi:esterase family protein [Calothrix sp. FACHB-1219]|uniref:alpha/beta hydrolase n=1 Tax=unclassified Calothrix TaxID=2619626 RepID=UPI0016831976|nr:MULTISPECIES: alpha/beta hydrolase-fold protein [unclassified Calothrix]MBD2202776.1 esterase family protein [Calothrix sp. FACHB-168]MBD2218929.1 esterase family protein [Calothrix sp. FACHB-1219]